MKFLFKSKTFIKLTSFDDDHNNLKKYRVKIPPRTDVQNEVMSTSMGIIFFIASTRYIILNV